MTELNTGTPDEVVVPETPELPEPTPAPARKKNPVLIVGSILAVLLVGASIAFGVLYANQTSHNASLTNQVSDKRGGLADTEKKTQENATELTKAQEAQKIADEAKKKAEAESAPLAKCHEAAKKARTSDFERNEDAWQEALGDLYSNC